MNCPKCGQKCEVLVIPSCSPVTTFFICQQCDIRSYHGKKGTWTKARTEEVVA